MRRLAAVIALVLVAGCSSYGSATTYITPTPLHTTVTFPPFCAYYQPGAITGEFITVVAYGPYCSHGKLLGDITHYTNEPWTTTTKAWGQLFAMLACHDTTIVISYSGVSNSIKEQAGLIANQLQQAGCMPEVPQ